ncbi:MAG: FAD:protein FMN transferase [Gammaproteobacteria bacterium]|nr:FAD:protein FMN transferase [Gammaproteobacteria bacterium]
MLTRFAPAIGGAVPSCTKGVLLVAIVLAVCNSLFADERTRFQGATMGTTYEVKIVDLSEQIDAEALGGEIETELERVNGLMSTYLVDSELSRFNTSDSTDWITVSDDTRIVIDEALGVSRFTNGAFDVTAGPLVNLWGFGPGESSSVVPSDELIQLAKASVGYRRLHTNASFSAVKKDHPDIYIDLSAIAKGYAVDKVAELLESMGIGNYLVEVGGELRASGVNQKHRNWTIAIEKPLPQQQAVQRLVRLKDAAIATSGDYRDFFEHDGRMYSHTIDPRTGRPVDHQLASVAVISDSTMFADAMATALMVLGPIQGFELAERERIAALFIVREQGNGFKERITQAFAPYLIN